MKSLIICQRLFRISQINILLEFAVKLTLCDIKIQNFDRLYSQSKYFCKHDFQDLKFVCKVKILQFLSLACFEIAA